jgi:predicted CoA-binding protein
LADWRQLIVEDEEQVADIVRKARRIAVLGIKTEAQSGQPAFSVPRYLKAEGLEIVPVPVYFPEAQEILGEKVYRKVSDIPGEVDIVDVFRRPNDIPAHLEDLIAKHPKVVWFQSGIRNDAAAEQLARAGIRVVQDRCLKVDHQYLVR